MTLDLSPAHLASVLAAAPGAALEAAPGIWILRVCSAAEARAIAAACADAAWEPATINAQRAVDVTIRDAEVLAAATPAGARMTESVRALLFAATHELAARLAPQSVPAEVQIVRYGAGGRYVDHRDSPEPGATPRVLSVVWYLNDDFAGGATAFAEPAVRMHPVSGVAIAFLPHLLHRGEPVIAGSKLAITAWYHDLAHPQVREALQNG